MQFLVIKDPFPDTSGSAVLNDDASSQKTLRPPKLEEKKNKCDTSNAELPVQGGPQFDILHIQSYIKARIFQSL